MIPKYRYWDEKLGMCGINWMEFTLDTATYTANPFLLGGISSAEGKIVKEHNLIPKNIMQTIGKADKNGTEIWQGDVAIYVHPDTKEESLLYFKSLQTTKQYLRGRKTPTFSYNTLSLEELDCAHVIGNIHANPELLENQ